MSSSQPENDTKPPNQEGQDPEQLTKFVSKNIRRTSVCCDVVICLSL